MTYSGGRLPLPSHPDRERLVGEAHSRPPQALPAPCDVTRIALLRGEGKVGADLAHLVDLCERVGAPRPGPDAKHHVLQASGVTIVWEQHTEFATYTFIRPAVREDAERPFVSTAIDDAPQEWLSAAPGQVFVATHVAVRPRPDGLLDEAAAIEAFGRDDYAACLAGGRVASIAADFRLHGDGFSRFLVFDGGTTNDHRGRMVQKLLEIETYRLAALLGLPLARAVGPELSKLEEDLAGVLERLAALPHMVKDRDLLIRLTRIAAEAERLSARTAYRFAATAAYARLVDERVGRLREERIQGRQRIEVFIERRLAPAWRFCASVADRQARLAERIGRASQLLATRVDVSVEEQNARLLESMDNRARLQLRLQETVEGLSVVAITYYAVSLFSYLAKGLEQTGLPVSATVLTAAFAPLVLVGVWLVVRAVRAKLSEGGEGGHPPAAL